ncbi:hypothetical protein NPIL_240801 [Nephila pilipes]|uniref:Uncharacterized protein n=1 Tax=Nephila pilipes TaxID=299642 RepID=A0A8X6UJC3_NEPPI|nr:hypothetical protein NPIL_240801 [Nephila pilipes]
MKKIGNLLERISVKDRKPTCIPMDISYSKIKDNMDDNKEYRQVIGVLLYISPVSRLDVSLALNKLSSKNETQTEKDRTVLKKLIMYLNTTKYFNLVINSMSPPVFICYTDAD